MAAKGSSDVALEQPTDLRMQSLKDMRISSNITGHVPPVPSGPLMLPLFPAAASGKHLGLVVVNVTFTVDENGGVGSVQRNPRRFSTPTPYDQDFDAAVGAAVRYWRFEPGYAVPLAPGKDGVPIVGDPSPETAELNATITFNETGGVSVTSVH